MVSFRFGYLLLRLNLLGPDVIAQFRRQTDRVESPTRWRRWNSAFDHQLSKERAGVRLDDRRLRSNSNQAVGVVDRQPRVFFEPSARIIAVHAVVSQVEL